jgi:hypothetical protein
MLLQRIGEELNNQIQPGQRFKLRDWTDSSRPESTNNITKRTSNVRHGKLQL